MVDKSAVLRDNDNMKPTAQKLRWQPIEAAEKDVQAKIVRDFSASRMNATKWRELIESLEDFGFPCRFRWVNDPDVSGWMSAWLPYSGSTYFDTGPAGPFRTFTIEWMEIDPFYQGAAEGQAEEVERRLQQINVPYHWENRYIRIVGYVRNT